jgi:hypothetical protein
VSAGDLMFVWVDGYVWRCGGPQVVNAVMCRLGVSVCHPEKRWRMTSDFENDGDALQPTDDEGDWNEMVFYTRRNHPIKSYVRHVRYEQEEAQPS